MKLPEITNLFYGITAILSALGVRHIFSYWINKNKQKSVDYNTLLGRQDKIIEDLEEKLHELESKSTTTSEDNLKLKQEIFVLKNGISLLESSALDLPLPMWLKSSEGKLLATNSAYVETFVKNCSESVSNHLGQTDKCILGQEAHDTISSKEKEILANGSVIIYKESVKLAGIITDFIFILFPRKLGKVTLGITGIAINESSIK